MEKAINYIKGALIITLKDLEEHLEDQRSKRRILVPAKEVTTLRLIRERFKLKDKDKLRVNLRH